MRMNEVEQCWVIVSRGSSAGYRTAYKGGIYRALQREVLHVSDTLYEPAYQDSVA
jgi:hypothetical protein